MPLLFAFGKIDQSEVRCAPAQHVGEKNRERNSSARGEANIGIFHVDVEERRECGDATLRAQEGAGTFENI